MGLALFAAMPVFAQQKATINVHPEQGKEIISKHIYGQFAEHLGTCIYGGLWVGEDSKIPNTQGYRNDVLQALKDLKVPVLRWPGGCFADEYHWMDGIGPKENRPRMVNNNWGGTVEDNSFGTHEFLNLCELIGCEPYISGNVGSGSVEEMAKWVEYMTSEQGSPMAKLRKENGREKPWKVKFFGVGNEVGDAEAVCVLNIMQTCTAVIPLIVVTMMAITCSRLQVVPVIMTITGQKY